MIVDLNSHYGLNPAHSEVVEACKIVEPCDTLDMECSNGRNAVCLGQLGFNVTAIDTNSGAIDMLKNINVDGNLTNIKAHVYDINTASLDEDYSFISCTVTLMFIDPARVDSIIANMHERTVAGGYNLIFCAMNTKDHPCLVPFPFTLKAG